MHPVTLRFVVCRSSGAARLSVQLRSLASQLGRLPGAALGRRGGAWGPCGGVRGGGSLGWGGLGRPPHEFGALWNSLSGILCPPGVAGSFHRQLNSTWQGCCTVNGIWHRHLHLQCQCLANCHHFPLLCGASTFCHTWAGQVVGNCSRQSTAYAGWRCLHCGDIVKNNDRFSTNLWVTCLQG